MSDAGLEALAAPESVSWTVHPAAHSPARALLVLTLVLGACLFVAQIGGTPLYALPALLFLGFSLRAFFLPRRYRVDAEGAEEAGPLCATRRLPWARVKQVVPARFGVWLDERRVPSRLLPARGLFLRTQGNRAQVLAAVQACFAAQADVERAEPHGASRLEAASRAPGSEARAGAHATRTDRARSEAGADAA